MVDNSLKQDEPIEVTAELVATSAMISDHSWEILTHMYQETTKLILLTQGFINPIQQNRELLKEKLTDFIGFEKSFITLLKDIRSISERLNNILVLHKNKTGTPTEEEWVDVFAYTNAYTVLHNEFQTVVAPLIMALSETVQGVIPELTVPH